MTAFVKILGVLLVLAGLAIVWLPIPLGIVLIPVGLALIVATSRTAREWLRRRRQNNPGLNRWLGRMEGKVPERIAEPLRKTSPDRQAGQDRP